MNRFQGTNSARLYILAGRYDNPIPGRFLAPIDCLKILALYVTGSLGWEIGVVVEVIRTISEI